MKVEEFKIWLNNGVRKNPTIQNRITNCRKVETNEGDLDEFYEKDKGFEILRKLTYTTKSERENLKPEHKIPIDGDIRTGTSTLKNAVNLYMNFRNSSEVLNNQISRIVNNINLTEDEKKVIIKYRIGQSNFRKKLLNLWENSCSVSGLNKVNLLIASHIKPYSKCTSNEKYDVFNGLLLSPNYDKLFDKFLISFDYNGKIIISDLLTKHDMEILKISKHDFIKTREEHKKYLKFHNERLLELNNKFSL